MTHDAAPLAQHDAEAELWTDNERPLVTFALCAYNQERFIREAIEGAFAQTYEPLEIILSDDCSSDRTFEVMQEMAAAYSGAARIKLNRNASNWGIAKHVNRLVELSTGRLIVPAAGDDVSLPQRVEKLYKAWRLGGGEVKYMHSSAKIIHVNSELTGEVYAGTLRDTDTIEDILLAKHGALYPLGATQAWDRQIFETFGPLFPNVHFEDTITSARGAAIGQTKFIDEPLVLYRMFAGVSELELSMVRKLRSGRRPTTSLRRRYLVWVELIFEMRSYVPNGVVFEMTNRRRLEFYRYFLANNKKLTSTLFITFLLHIGLKNTLVEYARYRMQNYYDYLVPLYRTMFRTRRVISDLRDNYVRLKEEGTERK
jgi:glycosyltransferase involved in cell wall biosynthesis